MNAEADLASRSRTWVVATFWIYATAVALITVAPTRVHHHRHRHPWWVVVELVPFHVPPVSFVLNIAMFVPFGVLVPLLWARAGSVARIAGLALAASTVIELTQLAWWVTVGNHRTVDINDLMANTAGGVLGLIVLRVALAWRRAR